VSLIRFHSVSKRFDSTPVLREVYFRLGKGDKVGLIGKNGVGKTTVLKLILGQKQPTEHGPWSPNAGLLEPRS
jgi:ATP-binding cassette subfamily F protein 3